MCKKLWRKRKVRELDERRIYEEEDEIDLMELFHTILKHKVKIVIVTIVVMLLSTLGGYIYNRLNSILYSYYRF